MHYTASGIITPIGGRLVHRLREEPVLIVKQKFCASSWLITEINLNILFYFLNQLLVSQLVKNSSRFTESEDLLLFSSELIES